MKLACQLFAGVLLLIWSAVAMFSPMAFGAGTATHKSVVLPVLAILFSPVLIGLSFYLLNWSFLFLSARVFLVLTIAAPVAVCLLFGYPQLVYKIYSGVRTNGYFVKDAAVYYNGTVVNGVDRASFTAMEGDGRYARDRAHVFYEGSPIEGADSASFVPILVGDQPSAYFRDAKHVFSGGKTVSGVDPATFQLLGDSPYARDRSHAYHQEEVIDGADAASFEALDANIARDKARIYFRGEPILPTADAASFELLAGADFGRDASKVYALPSSLFPTAHEVTGADRATFTPLPLLYAKDSRRVYYAEDGSAVPIPNADAVSFTVKAWDHAAKSDARDKARDYLHGKVVRAE